MKSILIANLQQNKENVLLHMWKLI